MKEEFSKRYDPLLVEEKIYELWCNNNCFKQSNVEGKETFSVIMPPPNVTGKLHMGHALDNTLQDILVRYKRMQGFNVLWVPGLDHAAISTECKVVNMLKERGIKKEYLTREEFLKYAFDWKEKYGNIIINQVKRLGVSADWGKLKFTMDPSCSEAVKKVFVDLYNEGLIYRGERIINWCPNCQTSLSDIEVDFFQQKGNLWYIKYYLVGKEKEDYITVATTRPETLLGDTAVAVHPEDERYKKFIGQEVIVPIVNRKVPVLADNFVERDYGTGAVKITPAHDINDFEVGQRHMLDIISVISKKGTMLKNTGKYFRLSVKEARKEILKDLSKEGLILKLEDITHNVGKCYRCGAIVEPLVSSQWFVKTKNLAEPAIKCLKKELLEKFFKDNLKFSDDRVDREKQDSQLTEPKCNLDFDFFHKYLESDTGPSSEEKGNLNFCPERFFKIYLNWLLNIKDWCISRQIWWGHRIPAYYCKFCGTVAVSATEIKKCSSCGSERIYQDEDTLDTWFSSGLWPFSVFDWPKKTNDYKKFFPTSVLVTGYDIIFFWVARMVMLSLKFTGKVPFADVLIHGLVRDNLGRKMSKSLGNGVDPLDIIEDYGADTLRFALILGNTLGNDIRFSEKKITSSRNFINKLYNSARYIYLKVSENLETVNLGSVPEILCPEDRWILNKLNVIVKEVTENLNKFELGIALFKVYDFFWNDFCDWYIELSKIRLDDVNTQEEEKLNTKNMLVFVFINILKLFHPFIPFITENLWQIFTGKKFGFIMNSRFPEETKIYDFSEDAKVIDFAISVIKSIRKKRKELNVPAGKILNEIFIETDKLEEIEKGLIFIKRLARVKDIKLEKKWNFGGDHGFSTIVADCAKIFINNEELFNKEEEILKLKKELEKTTLELNKVVDQLKNEAFLKKAPEKVVNKIKSTKASLTSKMEKIKESISDLSKN